MNTTHLNRRGPLGWLAARTWRFWIAALMLAYPLSIGPVMWFGDHEMIPGSTLTAVSLFYVPLDLARLVPPVDQTIEWYADFWREGIPDDAVIQVDRAPDGRKGLSIDYR